MAEAASKGGEKMSGEPAGLTSVEMIKTALETGDLSQLIEISRAAADRLAALRATQETKGVLDPDRGRGLEAEALEDGSSKRPRRRRQRGDGSVYLRGRIWWFKYTVNGKTVSESSGSEKEADARKLLRKRLGELQLGQYVGPDAEKVTISELADDDVVTDYRVNEQDSLDKAQRSANRIKAFFRWRRHTALGAIALRSTSPSGRGKAR